MIKAIIDDLTGPLASRAGFFVSIGIFAMAAMALAAQPVDAKVRAAQFKLDNGMEVVVIPDHRTPVVTHMVWYRVGAADEPIGTSGIAHFLEHLMFKGTQKIPPGEFSKIIARNGGQDNAFTAHDITAYFQRIAKDRLPLVMEMEADRMTNLRLTEDDVLTERKVILEERRSRVDNDPSSILGEQMSAALYRSHPYGIPIIGWAHEMAALDREDALAFYKQYYAPNNAILVISGDVTVEEVKKLAADTYAKIPAVSDISKRDRAKEPPHPAPIRVQLEDARAGKATVQRYYYAPSYNTAEEGDAEALDLLMKIVGSGSTSRLYKSLIVKDKKAASAGGWYSGAGLDSGRIAVYAIASEKVSISDAEAAIDAVLDDVRENGVTQQELDRARNSYLADRVYGSDSQSRLARRYGWGLASGRTIEDIESWPERLQKVTLEDLQRVAKRYLDIKRSVTGVLLPKPTKAVKADDATPKRDS